MNPELRLKSKPNVHENCCEYCNKKFPSKSKLNQHMKFHMRQGDFECSLCNYSTKTKKCLASHIQTHTREKPHKCSQPNCSFATSRKFSLTVHQLVHKKGDPSLLKYKCQVKNCLYKTSYKSALTEHLRTHSTIKHFSCALCPYRSKQKSSVRKHHKMVHLTEKPFKCSQPECNYSCKENKALIIHMRIHTGERPFACSFPECSYKARQSAHLRKHKMTHTGEKPFKCFSCPYSASRRGHLVDHIRGHTGETPFPCKSCPYQAKSSSMLTYHVNSAHLGKKRRVKSKGTNVTSCPRDRIISTVLECKVAACGYSTGEESSLAVHLNAAHNLPRVIL